MLKHLTASPTPNNTAQSDARDEAARAAGFDPGYFRFGSIPAGQAK